PGAGCAMRRYRREDHRDTSRLYVPEASFPTAIVIFHAPASRPAIATLYRPGPSVAASSTASIAGWAEGPANVARRLLPVTGLPSWPIITTNSESGAPACGEAGSVNTMSV